MILQISDFLEKSFSAERIWSVSFFIYEFVDSFTLLLAASSQHILQ